MSYLKELYVVVLPTYLMISFLIYWFSLIWSKLVAAFLVSVVLLPDLNKDWFLSFLVMNNEQQWTSYFSVEVLSDAL